MARKLGQQGFSMVELMTVVAVMGIVTVIALPSVFRTRQDMRLKGDGRAIAQMVGVVKMRAASRFTRARLFADLSGNSFGAQYWDKTANAWVTDEGGFTQLSQGVSFGFSVLDTPPPNSQPAIQQSAPCTDSGGNNIGNTACIVFNSRGIPVNPTTGTPVGDNAIYLTNGVGVFVTTLTATPLVRLWWSPANTVAWIRQ